MERRAHIPPLVTALAAVLIAGPVFRATVVGWDAWSMAVATIGCVLFCTVAGRARGWLQAAALTALLLSTQLVLVPWLARAFLARPTPTGIGSLTSFVLGLMGLESTYSHGEIYVGLPEELVRLAPTWFSLGAPALLGALAAVLLVGAAAERRVPGPVRLAVTLALLIAFAVARHCIAILIQSTGGGFFTSPGGEASALVSFGLVPTALLLGAAPVLSIPLRRGLALPFGTRATPRARAAAVALLLAAMGVAGAASASVAFGQHKAGRVLVDDSHGTEWELAGAQFTPEWRGDMSVYSCSAFMESLGSHYLVRPHRQGQLTPSLLSTVDVLVLKVPSQPYAHAERDAIRSFLENGGGVIAIGDHTDLFGCNTHLNELTVEHGIRFNADSVTHWSGRQPGVSMGWGMSGLESVARNMFWLSGCSLSLSGRARPALVSATSFSDRADFGSSSFFGDQFCEPSERAEPTVTAAFAQVGEGLLCAMGDGTIMTNFAAFRPGRYEALRSMVAMANCRMRPEGRLARPVVMGIVLLSLASLVIWVGGLLGTLGVYASRNAHVS